MIEKIDKYVFSVVLGLLKKYPSAYNYKDDLKQEGFVYALEALNTFKGESDKDKEFWIKLQVRNRLQNYIHRNIFKHNVNYTDEHIGNESFYTISVRHILEPLNDLDKFILYLYHIKEFKIETISFITNMSEEIIHKYLDTMDNYFRGFRDV